MERKLRVVIMHDAVADPPTADDLAVLADADHVQEVMRQLGHAAQLLPFGLDLAGNMRALRAARPGVVFNLVETVGGDGRLAHLGAMILEHLGLSYTGVPFVPMLHATGKVEAKHLLRGG